MDKPCGCATAEQCFTNCCCHTPAETLAWARAHKVEPAVIAALQRRVAAAPARAEASCCVAKEPSRSSVAGGSVSCGSVSRGSVPSCCEVSSGDTVSTGVATSTNCCEATAVVPVGDDPAEPAQEPASGKSLSLRAMLACGGIVAEWFSCGVSLPPRPVAVMNGFDVIGSLPVFDESASPVRAAPDAPPPRVA